MHSECSYSSYSFFLWHQATEESKKYHLFCQSNNFRHITIVKAVRKDQRPGGDAKHFSSPCRVISTKVKRERKQLDFDKEFLSPVI